MINYTYRFRLYPNANQRQKLIRHFGVCRFVYNYFLDRRQNFYRANKSGSSYYKDCEELTRLKKDLAWIGEVNSQSLQQELKNLDTAYNRFFKKQSCFPKFHSKKRDKQSFRIPQFISIKDKKVKFPKFNEGIKAEFHREVDGKIKFATISCNSAGQYYVAICVEREIQSLPPSTQEVGIDLGIKTLATCSDSRIYGNIKPYRMLEQSVKHLHRKLSKTQKGSAGRERARRKLAKLYQRIANIRSNHLHQVSHQIISNNQAIYLEDLNVMGMLRNRRLAKSIQDVSLSELVRQLEYKGQWYGRTVARIDRFYPSSKICSGCGWVNESLTLSDRTWMCSRCHTEWDRDYNAAINILLEGKRTVGITGLAGGDGNQTFARKQLSVKPEVAEFLS